MEHSSMARPESSGTARRCKATRCCPSRTTNVPSGRRDTAGTPRASGWKSFTRRATHASSTGRVLTRWSRVICATGTNPVRRGTGSPDGSRFAPFRLPVALGAAGCLTAVVIVMLLQDSQERVEGPFRGHGIGLRLGSDRPGGCRIYLGHIGEAGGDAGQGRQRGTDGLGLGPRIQPAAIPEPGCGKASLVPLPGRDDLTAATDRGERLDGTLSGTGRERDAAALTLDAPPGGEGQGTGPLIMGPVHTQSRRH